MCSVMGYVRSIGVDTEGGDSIWFQLVQSPAGTDWVNVGEQRAWFTVQTDSANRRTKMGELIRAMQAVQLVYVKHSEPANSNWVHPGDSFVVDKFCVMQ